MKILICSVFALLLGPCNKSKHLASTPVVKDNSTVSIIYQTTPCFGRCPVYTMTISAATKQITFLGKSDTEKIGTFTKTISDQEIADLVNAFEKANFFSLEDKYLGVITDFPSKYITYSHNGLTKKIQDRSGGPDVIHELEKLLETIANSEGWKRSESEDH